MKYKHLFGPVDSRRLGVSLGVDCVNAKTCNLNCVYCECGATNRLTNARDEYVPASEILNELCDYLKNKPRLDYVTFGGSGEPTLNSALGNMVRSLKKEFPGYKTALLTNGTLLSLPEVREAIMPFDCVLPSLDAVSEKVFHAVNRPHPNLDLGRILEGLSSFSREYGGILLLEVFIVPPLNDTAEELERLKKVLGQIRPTRVQLNSLDRPGACGFVHPASQERLREIAEFLLPLPVEIISRNSTGAAPARLTADALETLLPTIRRRPLTLEEIALSLNATINDAAALLSGMADEEKLLRVEANGRIFYKSAL
jgi:wyosine [tRNA(Phe)-imidazoG37] synthetase (radical SAM superfamily)